MMDLMLLKVKHFPTKMKNCPKNKLITKEDRKTPKMAELIKLSAENPTLSIEEAEPEEEKKFPNKELEDTITEPIKMTLKKVLNNKLLKM